MKLGPATVLGGPRSADVDGSCGRVVPDARNVPTQMTALFSLAAWRSRRMGERVGETACSIGAGLTGHISSSFDPSADGTWEGREPLRWCFGAT